MNNNLNQNIKQKTIEWINIQNDMKLKFGLDVYESWLKKIDFVEEFKNYILISVSTRFIRDWITSRYLDQSLKIVNGYNKQINRIEISINDKYAISNNENESKSETIKKPNITFIEDSFLKYNRIDPNKNFNNFILGSSNKLAFEASKK